MYEFIFFCSGCQTKVAVQEPELGGSAPCPSCGIELFFPHRERALKMGFERRLCSNLEELEVAVAASRAELSSRKAADPASRTMKAQKVSRLAVQPLLLPRHAQACRHTLKKGSPLLTAAVFSIAAILFALLALPFAGTGAGWILLVLSLPLGLAALASFLCFWHRFLSLLQLHPNPTMSPILEAGLLLVPGVNLYLIARFWWQAAGRYREIIAQQQLPSQGPPLDQTFCRLAFIPGIALVPLLQMHRILNWTRERV
ncbi:MAG: hypothetical protein RL095_2979 [Verrucomicrobiota bacterium]|jgi:DNA-directed RNA polymerase subunit RPC12/RpoP